jgi:adenylosuccinate synthase
VIELFLQKSGERCAAHSIAERRCANPRCRRFETLFACTAYQTEEGITRDLPFDIHPEFVQPIYTEIKGWSEDLTGLSHYDELPQSLKSYISFLEKELEVPVAIVSVGPDRNQTIRR